MKCLVFEKIKTVLVSFANFIISLSAIDPEGCITALTPDWISFSIPSTNGKKASEAATVSEDEILNFFILSIAIWQLSNLLGWPEPIPIVDLFDAKTIAFDFTYLQTLRANIRSSNWDLVGFFLDTTLKFFFVNTFLSSDWINIFSLADEKVKILLVLKFDAAINL